jgi:hypothetical protein
MGWVPSHWGLLDKGSHYQQKMGYKMTRNTCGRQMTAGQKTVTKSEKEEEKIYHFFLHEDGDRACLQNKPYPELSLLLFLVHFI